METLIYNIDSNDRNKTSYSNSHNFTYNKVDTTIDSIVRVEPFNVKNVIEINVGSVEIPNNFYYINRTKGNNAITTVTRGDETIPDGSYTKEELMTALATTSGISAASYSSTTGKVTLTTGSNFTFSNVSYRPNCAVPFIENSKKLEVAEILAKRNNTVTIQDNEAIIKLVKEKYGNLFLYKTI